MEITIDIIYKVLKVPTEKKYYYNTRLNKLITEYGIEKIYNAANYFINKKNKDVNKFLDEIKNYVDKKDIQNTTTIKKDIRIDMIIESILDTMEYKIQKGKHNNNLTGKGFYNFYRKIDKAQVEGFNSQYKDFKIYESGQIEFLPMIRGQLESKLEDMIDNWHWLKQDTEIFNWIKLKTIAHVLRLVVSDLYCDWDNWKNNIIDMLNSWDLLNNHIIKVYNGYFKTQEMIERSL
jgi:hypothetical protein